MGKPKPKGAKYYKRVLEYRQADEEHPYADMPPFDFETLRPPNLWKALESTVFRVAIPPLLAVARRFFPVFALAGYHWITRKSDVLDALQDAETFNVPYGYEMEDLSWSSDHEKAAFLLGCDGPVHDRQRRIIERVMRPGDKARLGRWAQDFSASLIEGSKGEIDVVGDLIVRVPTEICRRYFGLDFPDPARFAEWAMSVSALLFADPTGLPETRTLARAGALRLNHVIDAAIRAAVAELRSTPAQNFDQLSLVERLVWLASADPSLHLKHPEIRAIVLGLIVGFIPTNALAAANLLEGLLKRPAEFAQAREAAAADETDRLHELLWSAARRNPALSPGQWRYATRATTVRGHEIPKGATVMVSTMSALRDPRPDTQQPPRDDSLGWELMFGSASHKCMGQHLAYVVIDAMFLELLRQPGLRRARGRKGRMTRTGYFPRRLHLTYESLGAQQSMVICAVPLAEGVAPSDITDLLRSLGNPAPRTGANLADALDATGIVYFASGAVVEADAETQRHCLLLEFNADGPRDNAIAAIAAHAQPWLGPVLDAARPGDTRTVAERLNAYALDLKFWPWGETGLNFQGLPGFTVAEIARQRDLRQQVAAAVSQHLTTQGGGLESRPIQTLRAVRRQVTMASQMDAFLIQPLKEDPLTRWRKPKDFWQPLRKKVLPSPFGLKVAIGFLVTWLLMGWLAFAAFEPAVAPDDLFSWLAELLGPLPRGLRTFATVTMAGVLGLVASLLLWAALIAAAVAAFLLVEAREPQDDEPPDPAAVAAIAEVEDAPNVRQNHITAVTLLKPGLIRRVALAVALWGIRQSLHWFRPGFVTTMGTIHFAKWFRLPGSRKLIFQSNYDGSWESYLEDFITRAHPGQTAAWSNGVGFPRSRRLVGEGAKDGDRFKRWVRRQQVVTPFWYVRFPDLTAEEIRTNKLVHAALARANTDTKARAWLDLLGSAPRQHYEIEAPEVQSLVFRGLKGALYVGYAPFKLPPNAEGRAAWLREELDKLTFGQFPREKSADYLAFSAAGLAAYASDARRYGQLLDLLKQFPHAFTAGMAARARTLGDAPPDDPNETWLWCDAPSNAERPPKAEGPPVADGVLILYRRTAEALKRDLRAKEQRLAGHKGRFVHGPILTVTLDFDGRAISNPAAADASYEHFGFRDGISSPVIRGNEQFTGRTPQDVVEPGEFILGYYNNQGYVAPPVLVPAASDPFHMLPVPPSATVFGFADFQDDPEAPFEARDFSRNGFYLVLRQLRQDVEGFWEQAEDKASVLRGAHGRDRLRALVGDEVTAEWVAAKLVGRWPDGRPLIGNPMRDRQVPLQRSALNDFHFGRDDPRGHACPLGAHIRRANPRDSLVPDDPLEQLISRRHALIRRGRSYFYDPERETYPTHTPRRPKERGMVFAAVCADLERQFELVQQTWLGSPSFHGLVNEPDPTSTRRRHDVGARCFTIPTPAGPLVLKGMQSYIDMRAGGYFFAPSRSALRYLAALARPDDEIPVVPGAEAPP